uniref:Uncharacterized protein n=1 Tax=viral metagenome TaxID=1070528 RepID=A0A6C0B6V5_9ZZZZ
MSRKTVRRTFRSGKSIKKTVRKSRKTKRVGGKKYNPGEAIPGKAPCPGTGNVSACFA